MLKKLTYTILSFLIATAFCCAQSISEELAKFKNDPLLKHASVGLCIKNLSTQKSVIDYNSQLALTPASTLKILTTASAFEILGSNYKYTTKIEVDKDYKITNGVLTNSDLVIKASGDPTLGSELFSNDVDLVSIVKLIQKKAIITIDGNLVINTSCFDNAATLDGWIWADIGNYYGAGVYGLNYKDNKYKLFFNTDSAIGNGAQLIKKENTPVDFIMENEVNVSNKKGDNSIIYSSEYDNNAVIRGTLPAGKKNYDVEGAITNPPKFFAEELKKTLQKNNIVLKGKIIIEQKAGKQRTAIDSLLSPSVRDIIYYTNLKSINLFAEALLKTIDVKLNGIGNTKDAFGKLKKYWTNKVSLSGSDLWDGSGLSPLNKITPQAQVDLLSYVYKQSYYNDFFRSLPIAGISGSLSNMCKDTPAEGRIFAKSGYIQGVRAYCGYVKTQKGEWLAFSFIVNNFTGNPSEIKKKMEKIFVAMCSI